MSTSAGAASSSAAAGGLPGAAGAVFTPEPVFFGPSVLIRKLNDAGVVCLRDRQAGDTAEGGPVARALARAQARAQEVYPGAVPNIVRSGFPDGNGKTVVPGGPKRRASKSGEEQVPPPNRRASGSSAPARSSAPAPKRRSKTPLPNSKQSSSGAAAGSSSPLAPEDLEINLPSPKLLVFPASPKKAAVTVQPLPTTVDCWVDDCPDRVHGVFRSDAWIRKWLPHFSGVKDGVADPPNFPPAARQNAGTNILLCTTSLCFRHENIETIKDPNWPVGYYDPSRVIVCRTGRGVGADPKDAEDMVAVSEAVERSVTEWVETGPFKRGEQRWSHGRSFV